MDTSTNTTGDGQLPLVLIIDDSVDVHRLLKARLRGESLRLTHASGGQEGIDAAINETPAIVLLDVEMPEVDGFEVLRRLKDEPATAQVPVIVLSGLQSPHDKVTAFDLGAVDYITKPFDLTELRVRVRSALRLHTLLQMLAQKAQLDGLTGLWNRSYFDDRWAEEISRMSRSGSPLALAMLDLDHFKSINDNYGHPAGDAVLEGAASILRRLGRQSDIPCRYGGEEFALIMPDTDAQQAEIVCERFRAELEEQTWSHHPERRVTTSIGIAAGHDAGVSAADWIHAADQNLYKAKNGGRNQIVASTLGPKLAQAG